MVSVAEGKAGKTGRSQNVKGCKSSKGAGTIVLTPMGRHNRVLSKGVLCSCVKNRLPETPAVALESLGMVVMWYKPYGKAYSSLV